MPPCFVDCLCGEAVQSVLAIVYPAGIVCELGAKVHWIEKKKKGKKYPLALFSTYYLFFALDREIWLQRITFFNLVSV